MKHFFALSFLLITGFLLFLSNSCKKDSTPYGSTSFTEEFQNVYMLQQKGWVIKDNTVDSSGASAPWNQGSAGPDKLGVWYGFNAYSYTLTPDEFIYSYIVEADSNHSISSWLISPVLTVKNGDKISFYTRGDSTGVFTDRMQVLMSHSTSSDVGGTINSVGDFTTTLLDINASQAAAGYPTSWTRYEYIFSGISEKNEVRIAFRHYDDNPINARGVGIDLFQFQAN
jgi:hypothetical protein